MICFATVIGCGDYEAPPGAVATRTGDRVSVQCGSGAYWELRCELGRWVGRTYNCSDAEWTQAWTIGKLLKSPGTFSRRKNFR